MEHVTLLAPPWYTLWNEVKHTIGNDKSVQVLELETKQNPYKIRIITNDVKKGEALATLLESIHFLGNIDVVIQVEDKEGQVYEKKVVSTTMELKALLSVAFEDNSYYVGTVVQSLDPGNLTFIYPVFTKSVIQFYNDELSDLYHNYNEVTAKVFKQLIVDEVNGLAIGCSTEKDSKKR